MAHYPQQQMKTNPPPKGSTSDITIDRATEEIKIIQDKINKLGDDRLKVKTWSITLILAALLSGKSLGLSVLGYVALLAIPLVFLNYEGYLNHQIYCLGKRARQLERFIYEKSDGKNRTIGRIPGLATWITDGGFSFEPPKKKFPHKRTLLRWLAKRHASSRRRIRQFKWWKKLKKQYNTNSPYLKYIYKKFQVRSTKHAEILFYAAQVVIIIFFALLLKAKTSEENTTSNQNLKTIEKIGERLRRSEEYRVLRETQE